MEHYKAREVTIKILNMIDGGESLIQIFQFISAERNGLSGVTITALSPVFDKNTEYFIRYTKLMQLLKAEGYLGVEDTGSK